MSITNQRERTQRMAKIVEKNGMSWIGPFTRAELAAVVAFGVSRSSSGSTQNKNFPEKGPEPPLSPNGVPKCPVCHGEMSEKQGTSKAGNPYHFWSCKDWKGCGTTVDVPFGPRCPDCGRFMNKKTVKKTGKEFYACSGGKTSKKSKTGAWETVREVVCGKTMNVPKAPAPEPAVEESPFSNDDFGFDAGDEEVPF